MSFNETNGSKTMLATFVLILALLSNLAMAQMSGKGSGEGKLIVTATVAASASLTVEPDGQMRMVIANAPAPGDAVSRFVPLKSSTGQPDKQSGKPKEKAKRCKSTQ
jgi:hypothetical protein